MSRTRVLVVYHHLPHYRFDIFKQLESDPSLEVEFASAYESRDGSIPTIPPDRLHCFHPLRNVWMGPFLWQVGLLSLILRRRPQTVIFLGVFTYLSSWVGSLLSKLIGARVLFWTIGWHRPEHGVRRHVRILFYRLADKLMLYGHVGRQIGIELGYPAEKMTVIYNSSSDPLDSPASSHDSTSFLNCLEIPDTVIVGAVIRLTTDRRLDLLIKATALLRGNGRNVGVILIGDGPARAGLDDLAAKLGVPLRLPGPAYSDTELSAFYRRCLVTVVPSAAGLTVLQSLKFGRPVVTHDEMHRQGPECEAIVPGETGDLYRYDEVESLADTMGRWLDRQALDSGVVAKRCREVVRSTWSAQNQSALIRAEIHAACNP